MLRAFSELVSFEPVFREAVFFLSHGHLLLRADSQLSRRSFTTDKESVNLRFSRNRLSTTNAVRLSFVCGSDAVVLALLPQLTSMPANNVAGKIIRTKIHLFDEFVVMYFSFGFINWYF